MIYLVLAALFGFFMAWGIGANDVANAMGTSVGAKALTIKQAIFIAIIFEFLGAWLAGAEVTSTIRKGIVDTSLLESSPELLVYGMLASLLAAGVWLLIASGRGWPVSTTHSIVGAIVGFAVAGIGMSSVHWGKVAEIAASWVISPLLAGTAAFIIFWSVRLLILDRDEPLKYARRFIPFYMFLVGFLIALVSIFKGLKNVLKESEIILTNIQSVSIAAGLGIAVAFVGAVMIGKIVPERDHDSDGQIEKVFGILMIFTACAMAFAHGSNDVANAIGPVAAILSVVESGAIGAKALVPQWVLLLGAAGIVVGLATYGSRVMATIGTKITELTPSRGFAAELGAAATVVLASTSGLPVSTTHTLVGAVLGVGLAQSTRKINTSVVGTIVMSWLITIPVGATLSIIFFYIFKAFLPGL